jgi:hypothetical protein
VEKGKLLNHYFDHAVNRKVFDRTCKKCYFPSNQILLEEIDKHKREKKQVKVSFRISKPNLLSFSSKPLSRKRRIR